MESEPIGGLSRALDPALPLGGLQGITLVDFWQWGYSDVLSNGVRGVLGEYLVALALGVTKRPRVEWDAVDLRYRSSKIEVKTTSAHQAWPLAAGSKRSLPSFDIGRRRGWDASTGITALEAERLADCYVLCVYLGPNIDADTNLRRRVSVLDVRLWAFHVIRTAELDDLGGTKRVGLARIAARWPPVVYDDLAETIDRAVTTGPD